MEYPIDDEHEGFEDVILKQEKGSRAVKEILYA
jgi:hypothetical protein